MPKPTLLQTLLGRPSRSYAFPPDRQYYSSKDDLARAAAALAFSPSNSDAAASFDHTEVAPLPAVEQSADGYQNGRATVTVNRAGLSGAPLSNEGIPLPFSLSPQHQITSVFNPSDSDSDDSADDVFYTPFSSPPTSMLIDPPIPFISPEIAPSHSPDDKSSSSSTSSSSSSTHSALSCSTPPTSDELHAALAALQKRPASQSRQKRLSAPSKSYTYTDEDWAKEFRWLVQSSSSSSKRRSVFDSALAPPISNQPKHRPRPRTVVSRPITRRRMTALLEEDEDQTDDHRSSPPPSHVREQFSSSHSHTNSITSNSHDVRPPSQASHTHAHTISLGSRTVELPQFPGTSAPAPAPGYTTLTLPRASYRPEDPWRSLGGGRVDLPRDGRAQISMVSIEVVRGAVSSAPFFSSGFRKRSSAPRPKKHDLTGAIALSSHRPPPSFIPNSAVLVQVHAVGLEGLDKQILTDKLAVSDAGGKGATTFVPGRGILGRAVECGLEISSETLRKGEWVIGLLDAKKCGALCEFVLLDRHRVHRAPQPGIPMPIPTPNTSAPSFSLESLALLSVLGVPAYRGVRTYTASRSPSSSSGGTALVLRGQDGAGGLATLMLRATGVNVIIQVDPSAVGYHATVTAPSQPYMLFSESDDKALGTGIPRRLQEVCARMRAWGVEGICVGSPLAVLQTLDIDIDFVLDTVGGHEIWNSSRSLLMRGTTSRGLAQFTTTVGDAGSGKAVPTTQDHWRAGVGSLKRAMTIGRSSGSRLDPGRSSPSKARNSMSLVRSPSSPAPARAAVASLSRGRTVNYTWVACDGDVDFEGGDVRDAFAALLTMPALQHPSVPDALLGLGGEYGAGRVLPFERAPEAFGGTALEGGGSVVIRVAL